MPDFREQLHRFGMEPSAPNTPAEFAAIIAAEQPRWAKAVRDSGATAAATANADSNVVTPAGAPQQAATAAATSANAQQPLPAPPGAGRQPATNATGRKVARYDCANCHY